MRRAHVPRQTQQDGLESLMKGREIGEGTRGESGERARPAADRVSVMDMHTVWSVSDMPQREQQASKE